MIIAIDGTTGSGKSTISKALAKKFNFAYIRTGSFYRVLALDALIKNIPADNEQQVKKMLETINIDADFSGHHVKICLDGKDVSDKLNSPEVSRDASVISTLKSVREYVSKLQKDSATKYDNIVMEGRDIGSVVFPNAELKVYIDCDIDTRAKRRQQQFEQNGNYQSFEQIKKDILQRDYNDTHRAISPLIRLPEAFYLDTTNHTIEECVELIAQQIQKVQK